MEAKYEIIIYWSEEDNFYVTEVPELPGCMSDGTSYVEAIKKTEIVIQQWLETAQELGREIPKAKGKLMFA